jgi:hypothetical protein
MTERNLMDAKQRIEVESLERLAASKEQLARDIDAKTHVLFSPRDHAFWNRSQRADDLRAKARDLRDRASRIRRQSA